nr:hypothetical protein [Tanacetum cinerariifolium]
NTKAYKEYYACATGEAAPKPKASARRKRGDSDTSITPPTAIPTPITTIAITPRLTAIAKGKQPAKAKSPSDPSEAARTEAEQLKIILRRSRQEMHISQCGGSSTDEGTDVDAQDKDRNDDEGDTNDESDDAERNDDDDDDNDERLPKLMDQRIQRVVGVMMKKLKVMRRVLKKKQGKRKRKVLIQSLELLKIVRMMGRGLQVSQDIEDSHVTLTLVHPDGQQESSSMSSFVTSMLNLISDADRGSKRRREGGEPESACAPLEPTTRSAGRSITGSKSRQASTSESAFAEEPVQTISQIEEPSHPVFETGERDQPIVQTSQHPEWFPLPKKPPTPDHDWNKTLPAVQGSAQTLISELAKQADSLSSFNELLDTPIDFFNFIMYRLGVDTLTPELLAGPTYELMRGSCNSLTELEYHLEEVYKATTDRLDWVNPEGQQYPHNLLQPLSLIPNNRGRRVIPFAHFINNDLEYLQGGASSQKYTTSMTKTKAADYGHIKWIEDLVPRTMWIQEPINYNKHALWGVTHWGQKRQQFYGFAVNRESALDVYSKRRIIAVIDLKIVDWHNYKHLDWISVCRDDDKIYKFKEGDFKRLRLKDIEDMLLLLVQGKLSNLTVEECFAFNVSLRMFTRNSEDDGNGEEDQGLRVSEEQRLIEEEEADKLYRDVVINQGRGLQVSQDIEDSHVTLTSVHPDGLQESSSMSSFVTSMLNPISDAGVESIFTTASSSVAPLPTPIPIMTPSIITTITIASHPSISPTPIPSKVLQNLPTFDSVFCFNERLKSLEASFSEYMQTNLFAKAILNIPVVADLSEMELKKIFIEKMEGNKSIHRSDEQRNLYKALVDAYEADKTILKSYEDTAILKRRRGDDDDQEGPFAGSDWGSKR